MPKYYENKQDPRAPIVSAPKKEHTPEQINEWWDTMAKGVHEDLRVSRDPNRESGVQEKALQQERCQLADNGMKEYRKFHKKAEPAKEQTNTELQMQNAQVQKEPQPPKPAGPAMGG